MSIFLQILFVSGYPVREDISLYLSSLLMVWLMALLIVAPLLVFAAHLSAVVARCAELDERLETLIQKVQAKA